MSSMISLKVKKLSLTVNIRIKLNRDIDTENFFRLLLKIGSQTVNDKDGCIIIVKKN